MAVAARLPRQLPKKQRFGIHAGTAWPVPSSELVSATMNRQPRKASSTPPTLYLLAVSRPMRMAMSSVHMGCDGCHIDAVTALLILSPTRNRNWPITTAKPQSTALPSEPFAEVGICQPWLLRAA